MLNVVCSVSVGDEMTERLIARMIFIVGVVSEAVVVIVIGFCLGIGIPMEDR